MKKWSCRLGYHDWAAIDYEGWGFLVECQYCKITRIVE